MKKTILNQRHVDLGATMVPFAGWHMPLHYGSQLREHLTVREDCGVFDVSHMGIFDLTGPGVDDLLRLLMANDVAKIPRIGQGQYTVMLNERGNVTDDLIVYRLGEGFFSLVVNAGTLEKDLAWIRIHAASYGVEVTWRKDMAMLALQGPKVPQRLQHCLLGSFEERILALRPFQILVADGWRIARTGYTGEDGFEIMVDAERAAVLWDGLMRAGIAPVGLGARDTLRLEAGLNLYGQDMDEKTNPLESGLGWVVAWEPRSREFIGRKSLELRRVQPDLPQRYGLMLRDKGVLRNHQEVFLKGRRIGEITSGGYSPSLQKGIALARLEPGLAPGALCEVMVRGRGLVAEIVRPPFVAGRKK
ncbi:MAG: glycine cleavage system aminomethyltransferase GcvT [Magnetococcales bacterium]|nr:glycine cleavage system aminomethyltransferase GcvT [Magnetococcales bacterium]MBF0149058.1 glycine cleavage system aminomethyltransferase GcvT [Magnetococcales bacterium]MBF0173893.1 glycine cleavage system aminomethyltransferase GcvT [Magnetococcales bacterium]MBF0348907.1 glycine cleavage system aminomethyltransferase GcvT [Magnetococcales bacterium]MBF0630190.1 glycine cleavage system aminomethyltransferase GcvT [Magnetococcales bacterium]